MPQASKQIIGFALDPKIYQFNEIIQYVPSEKDLAVWPILSRDDFIRVDDPDDLVWDERSYRPMRSENRMRHKTDSANLIRRSNSTLLGEEEMRQFELYGLYDVHMRMLMTQLATQRAVRITALLETSGNWAGQTDTATNLGGGKWDVGTEAAPYFSKSINKMVRHINLATNGFITHQDVFLTLNLDDAVLIGQSAEIRQFLSRSEYAMQVQADPYAQVNQQFGLPPKYQGVRLRVDKMMKVTSKDPGDAGTDTGPRGYIKTAASSYMTTRPGGVMGVPGGTSFGTITAFYAGGQEQFSSGNGDVTVSGADLMFQIESFPDQEHRHTRLYATEKMIEVLVSPYTGYLATATTG